MRTVSVLLLFLSITIFASAQRMTPNPAAPSPGGKPSDPGPQNLGVDQDTVVLRAGNFSLTRSEYERLLPGFDRNSGVVPSGATPQSAATGKDIARVLNLTSEAQRRGIDKDPKMQALIQVRGYVLLANALFAYLKDEVKKDEAGTRSLFEKEQHNYFQIRARQILIRYQGVKTQPGSSKGIERTEAQAQSIADSLYKQLQQGANFSELAKANSDDEPTAPKGGEMPNFARGAMVAEFEDVAFKTPVGSYSQPFKSPYGYHIILVEEHPPVPFERVRPALEDMRARQIYEQIGSADIQLNDAYFQK